MKVKRVLIGDFWGDGERSPSGEFTVAHGIRLRGKLTDTADRHFVVLRHDRSVFRGERERVIFEGTLGGGARIDRVDVDDLGNFCLQTSIFGKSGDTLLFFRSTGEQYGSVFVPRYAYFVHLEQHGAQVLFATTEKVFFLNISPTHTIAAFDLPRHFHPISGYVDAAEPLIWLSDNKEERSFYRFDFAGKFIDEELWFAEFVKQASANAVYYALRDSYLSQQDWTPDRYRQAAQQIAAALQRGIKDSFHTRQSDILTFLGVLRRLAGDEPGAREANTRAEEAFDGFRAVDSIDSLIDEIVREADVAAMREQLQRLTKAETYPRLDHYPNYYGRLFKLKGSLFLALGERENAIAAFRRALEINPRIGCKRLLKSLESQT